MDKSIEPELEQKDPQRIREMFAEISGSYDLANTLLTGAVDSLWRRQAAVMLREALALRTGRSLTRPPTVLDACAGTGKLARRVQRELSGDCRVVAADFCRPLLVEGRRKEILDDSIPPVVADLLHMPVRNSSFDAVTIAFGYRNLTDRRRGLREIRRLLRPGGLLLVLEFHPPEGWFLRDLYLMYFRRLLPVFGRWIAGGDTTAYDYLSESVMDFPSPTEVTREFREEGFRVLKHQSFLLGITHHYLLEAEK